MGKKVTQEYIISNFTEVHGDKYGYDSVVYVNSATKVDILCKQCFLYFSQTPNKHAMGRGCPTCKAKNARLRNAHTKEQFVSDAQDVHGTQYDYFLSKYVNAHTDVAVLCTVCDNVFEVSPSNHVFNKSGCPTCNGQRGYSRAIPGMVYVLSCDDMVKVGITNRTVRERIRSVKCTSGKDFKIVLELPFDKGYDAAYVESVALKILRVMYENPTERFDGFTETFTGVPVDTVIRVVKAVAGHLDKL